MNGSGAFELSMRKAKSNIKQPSLPLVQGEISTNGFRLPSQLDAFLALPAKAMLGLPPQTAAAENTQIGYSDTKLPLHVVVQAIPGMFPLVVGENLQMPAKPDKKTWPRLCSAERAIRYGIAVGPAAADGEPSCLEWTAAVPMLQKGCTAARRQTVVPAVYSRGHLRGACAAAACMLTPRVGTRQVGEGGLCDPYRIRSACRSAARTAGTEEPWRPWLWWPGCCT